MIHWLKCEVFMLSNKVGFWSSVFMTITVVLFAIGMIIDNSTMSFFVCLLLSWAFVLVTCSFAANVSNERKVFAYGAIAFACIYALLVDIVYFTQLTTVAHQTASSEILTALSFQSLGSWMFNLDLLGYGMMSLSTFLLGLTILPNNKTDKWLKVLLMVHGIFLVSCVLMPMLNVFSKDMGAFGDKIGTLALLVWCAYFTPIGVLSALHFKKLS